jgi:DNA-binding PadR family transcriptional regulator
MSRKTRTKPDTLGQFEQLVLTAVLTLGEEAYGVPIHEKITGLAGGKPAHLGSMYVTLDRLEAKGYVRSRLEDTVPDGRRRTRRFYRMEPDGERALRESVATARRVYETLGDPWRLGRWKPNRAG